MQQREEIVPERKVCKRFFVHFLFSRFSLGMQLAIDRESFESIMTRRLVDFFFFFFLDIFFQEPSSSRRLPFTEESPVCMVREWGVNALSHEGC